jgi:hypothetical protein
MKKELAEGIKSLFQALHSNEVKYLFVGGVAISYYGSPRPSVNLPKEIDYDIYIWYLATNEDFTKLTKAIFEISPELKGDLEEIVVDPKKTFIKFNLDEFHFDFLQNLVAFYRKDFEGCYNKKEIGKIEGVQIDIISKNDLL